MTKPKARITDADIKPPRLIDSTDIAGDVERFLAAGGRIDRPAFRQDRVERQSTQKTRQRLRWKRDAMPPELKNFNTRGRTSE